MILFLFSTLVVCMHYCLHMFCDLSLVPVCICLSLCLCPLICDVSVLCCMRGVVVCDVCVVVLSVGWLSVCCCYYVTL